MVWGGVRWDGMKEGAACRAWSWLATLLIWILQQDKLSSSGWQSDISVFTALEIRLLITAPHPPSPKSVVGKSHPRVPLRFCYAYGFLRGPESRRRYIWLHPSSFRVDFLHVLVSKLTSWLIYHILFLNHRSYFLESTPQLRSPMVSWFLLL